MIVLIYQVKKGYEMDFSKYYVDKSDFEISDRIIYWFAVITLGCLLGLCITAPIIFVHIAILFWYGMFISFIAPIEFFWFQYGIVFPVMYKVLLSFGAKKVKVIK